MPSDKKVAASCSAVFLCHVFDEPCQQQGNVAIFRYIILSLVRDTEGSGAEANAQVVWEGVKFVYKSHSLRVSSP